MKDNWRDGNNIRLLVNGDEFFPRVFDAIRAAEHEILLETFIVEDDPVGRRLQRELIAAAERGVSVDVTLDGYGSGQLSDAFINALTTAGVKLHIFDPQPKLLAVRLNIFRRLHRKLIVIDQSLAFVGGINFCFDHVLHSGPKAKQDYAVEVKGTIVADIHHTCKQLRLRSSSRAERQKYKNVAAIETSPIGTMRALFVERDNSRHHNDIERQYLLAIRTARQRIVIANAYFFPGYRLLRELRRAAQRGVDVTLLLQGQPDMPWVSALSRLLYNYLIRAGVKICEYKTRPLHGKVALMDDKWSTVGSSNLDPLSLSLNLEANLIIEDEFFNKLLFENLTRLLNRDCEQLTLQTAVKGYWWRMPLIFLSFHFLRRFPTILGWLPAHQHQLALVKPDPEQTQKTGAARHQGGHPVGYQGESQEVYPEASQQNHNARKKTAVYPKEPVS